MLTIFAVPKSFCSPFDVIQWNAIKSWTLLESKYEIILLGDDEGTAEVAKEFNLKHIPDIARNEYGTPLNDSMFEKAQKAASGDILACVNADIILMDDLMKAIEIIKKFPIININSPFLMVGQRHDLDLKERLDFDNHDWQDRLRSEIAKRGTLHSPDGADYFIYLKSFWISLPPFCYRTGSVR